MYVKKGNKILANTHGINDKASSFVKRGSFPDCAKSKKKKMISERIAAQIFANSNDAISKIGNFSLSFDITYLQLL